MLRWVRRPLAALLVLGAGVSACGGGPSDAERVHAAVEAFGRATAAKDYQRLCDRVLAPELVEEVESSGLPCEVALQQGLGEVEAPTLTIGRIEVYGDGPRRTCAARRRGSLRRGTRCSSSAWGIRGGSPRCADDVNTSR